MREFPDADQLFGSDGSCVSETISWNPAVVDALRGLAGDVTPLQVIDLASAALPTTVGTRIVLGYEHSQRASTRFRAALWHLRARHAAGKVPPAGIVVSAATEESAQAWVLAAATTRTPATLLVPPALEAAVADLHRDGITLEVVDGGDLADRRDALTASGQVLVANPHDLLCAAGAGSWLHDLDSAMPDIGTVVITANDAALLLGTLVTAHRHHIKTVLVTRRGAAVPSAVQQALADGKQFPGLAGDGRRIQLEAVTVGDAQIETARAVLLRRGLAAGAEAAMALAALTSTSDGPLSGYRPERHEKVAVLLRWSADERRPTRTDDQTGTTGMCAQHGHGQRSSITVVDDTVARSAGIHSYLVDSGKDCYPKDIEIGRRLSSDCPSVQYSARAARAFLERAVHHLADVHGIAQFVELGSGYPFALNVHEVARAQQPTARTLYVDSDPVIAAHGRALLANIDGAFFAHADVTDTDALAREIAATMDTAEPIALCLGFVAEFVADPHMVVEAVSAALPGPIYWILSHVTTDVRRREEVDRAVEIYRTGGIEFHPRTKETIAEIVAPCELLSPGLVAATSWWPETASTDRIPTLPSANSDTHEDLCLAAVGRVR
ncbi:MULTISPECIES: SAM-dependent methyltransferase [Nocardia]|uniref:SAM-dependent methyltransferase n=1 Tax=Nocardia TaxID=1817 RepID=UPI000AD3BA2A|nr:MULTISPECIES: SAM-dependent methyltransferase [Nocardia]MCC3311398.1 SAM-dependent methyltransferase [Nocardia africana]